MRVAILLLLIGCKTDRAAGTAAAAASVTAREGVAAGVGTQADSAANSESDSDSDVDVETGEVEAEGSVEIPQDGGPPVAHFKLHIDPTKVHARAHGEADAGAVAQADAGAAAAADGGVRGEAAADAGVAITHGEPAAGCMLGLGFWGAIAIAALLAGAILYLRLRPRL